MFSFVESYTKHKASSDGGLGSKLKLEVSLGIHVFEFLKKNCLQVFFFKLPAGGASLI
jgi:hypothetical protein